MDFRIFPNPAQDELNLNLSLLKDIQTIQIITATGKVIRTIDPSTAKSAIDISQLESGIYFVAIATSKGISNQKFIKTE